MRDLNRKAFLLSRCLPAWLALSLLCFGGQAQAADEGWMTIDQFIQKQEQTVTAAQDEEDITVPAMKAETEGPLIMIDQIAEPPIQVTPPSLPPMQIADVPPEESGIQDENYMGLDPSRWYDARKAARMGKDWYEKIGGEREAIEDDGAAQQAMNIEKFLVPPQRPAMQRQERAFNAGLFDENSAHPGIDPDEWYDAQRIANMGDHWREKIDQSRPHVRLSAMPAFIEEMPKKKPEPEKKIVKSEPPPKESAATVQQVAAKPALDPEQCMPDEAKQYLSRRMAALESDRRTLDALRAAVRDLKLQNELDFLPLDKPADIQTP